MIKRMASAISDKQNEELFELIRSIKSSEDGQRALQSIYQEADSTGAGKGDVLKSIWEHSLVPRPSFPLPSKAWGRG